MTEEERMATIEENRIQITNQAKEGTSYDVNVKSFFAGNEYYLFIYETYNDVRFVGAPPSSIGKFGADTDNWMWPRHTGDFSLFRVYTDKDGNPAEYSDDNIPMKPKHALPVSIDGVKKGDFSMILGYPGGTERYLTSFGVKMALEQKNQTIVDIRDKKLKIMREDMDADNDIRIKYASKYARTANYWKYFIGQTKGLKRLKVYDKKLALENEFSDWVNESEKRKNVYGEALMNIEDAYEVLYKYEKLTNYLDEAIWRGSEILGYAWSFNSLVKAVDNELGDDMVVSTTSDLRNGIEGHFKDYNIATDQKLLGAMLKMFYDNVSKEFHPEYLTTIHKKYKGDFDKFESVVFSKSIFAQATTVNDFLDDFSVKKIKKDPAFKLMSEFVPVFRMVYGATEEAYINLDKGNRLFIAGLREMNPQKKFYPDANFTMRLTYGQVLDYFPADAIHFNYFTTLKGVMEKEDPNNWEFVVHDKLKELYHKKDYGRYGEDGEMHMCFLTNHDITGGNSGSPVINGKGELIGLAFDGNWEAMSGDIAFEPELQRTINVDIRYVLFIIDKFAGADRLINEMNIVSTSKKPVDKILPPMGKQEKEIN